MSEGGEKSFAPTDKRKRDAARKGDVLRSRELATAATILFVGYQGEGTLGAHLQAGAKTVKLDGQVRTVRCRVRSISGFSAHADESQLLEWISRFRDGVDGARRPRRVFLVHGDPEAQQALEPKVRALGFETRVPEWHERVTLD